MLPVLALCAIIATASAAEKIDLERVTPVPANEPIPVQDFFRPASLQEPMLNPAGTHIAAVITAEKDSHLLLVNELGTQKMESFGGLGDKDIHSVRWLNDSRLVFELASMKLYSFGLFAANVGRISEAYPLV